MEVKKGKLGISSRCALDLWRGRSKIDWNGELEGKAVEVTAVVASELGDERWSPGGRKAAAWLDGGQAAEGCVHKDRLVVGVEHEFVRIHLTGGEAGSGYIKAITALMELAWRE